MSFLFRAVAGVLIALTGLGALPARAQNDDATDLFPNLSFEALGAANTNQPATWSSQYVAADGKGELSITAKISGTWHVYSTTQEPGGPTPAKFSVDSPESVKVTGVFKPNVAPDKSVSDIYKGLTIEEHGGVVTWTAPIELPADFQGDVSVVVKALACTTEGACVPIDEALTAKFAGAPVGTVAANAKPARQVVPQNAPSGINGFGLPGGFAPGTPMSENNVLNTLQEQTLSGTTESKINQLPKFRDKGYQVQWVAWTSTAIAPGQQGAISFRAAPDDTFHVYAAATDDAMSATNFVVTEKNGIKIGTPKPDTEVITKTPEVPEGLPKLDPVSYHEGTVTWTLPVTVPAGTPNGDYKVSGMIAYQACTDKACMLPQGLQFDAVITVSATADDTPKAVQLTSTKSAAALDAAATIDWVDSDLTDPSTKAQPTPDQMADSAVDAVPNAQTVPVPETAPRTDGDARATSPAVASIEEFSGEDSADAFGLPLILLMAFGGGLILNLMPCVLPVVGLKIMSFVQQAGENRQRVFLLNAAYVIGILAVFGLLTALAVLLSFSWGEQFTYFPVRLGLTLLVFALALSYLGVWEIPAPGMAAGQASQDLQSREGYVGAFFKGAFTTVMATPCSGPLLGFVLGYTISLSPAQTALVIMTVGLGMASPYIALGLFPSLVNLLPKPGDWMVTLKEFLAFLFLGTVAYFFNQFSDGDKLPVFVSLIGVWFGCWIIGKVPAWETINKRITAWTSGIVSAAIIGILAFSQLGAKELPAVAAPLGRRELCGR